LLPGQRMGEASGLRSGRESPHPLRRCAAPPPLPGAPLAGRTRSTAERGPVGEVPHAQQGLIRSGSSCRDRKSGERSAAIGFAPQLPRMAFLENSHGRLGAARPSPVAVSLPRPARRRDGYTPWGPQPGRVRVNSAGSALEGHPNRRTLRLPVRPQVYPGPVRRVRCRNAGFPASAPGAQRSLAPAGPGVRATTRPMAARMVAKAP
jgi:hypothetical protein